MKDSINKNLEEKQKVAIAYAFINKKGGTERYWYYLTKYLSEQYDMEAFSALVEESVTRKIKLRKVPILRKPYIFLYLSFLIMSSLKILALKLFFGIRYKVQHCTGPDMFKPDICTAQVCQASRLQAVKESSMDGRGLVYFLRQKHFSLLLKITAFLEKIIFNRRSTRSIICVSYKIKRELSQFYGCPESKMTVIPNGVDLSVFNPGARDTKREQMRDHIGLNKDDFVVIFSTSDWQRKGLTTLFKAVPLLDILNLKVLVVGYGQRDLEYYSKMSMELGIDKIVNFFSFSDSIEDYYSAADILVHPSYYDSFAMTPLEAMAMGIPVIISATSGLSDWVKDGTDGLILKSAADHIELANLIEKLYSDAKLRGTISKNCAEMAKQFSWDKVMAKTAQIYERVSG